MSFFLKVLIRTTENMKQLSPKTLQIYLTCDLSQADKIVMEFDPSQHLELFQHSIQSSLRKIIEFY